MPLLKTKALPVSDVPNCESWVNGETAFILARSILIGQR